MSVFAKQVYPDDSMFKGRETIVMSPNEVVHIPVPNNVVLCNGCNRNIAEMEATKGYLVFLGKRELDKNSPYDIYCSSCVKRYFPKAIIIEEKE